MSSARFLTIIYKVQGSKSEESKFGCNVSTFKLQKIQEKSFYESKLVFLSIKPRVSLASHPGEEGLHHIYFRA